jgi:hypothetical protein
MGERVEPMDDPEAGESPALIVLGVLLIVPGLALAIALRPY